MDIAGLSMAMSQQKVMDQMGIALLSKALDTTEVFSEGVTDMIDAIPAPSPAGVGGHIDILI